MKTQESNVHLGLFRNHKFSEVQMQRTDNQMTVVLRPWSSGEMNLKRAGACVHVSPLS